MKQTIQKILNTFGYQISKVAYQSNYLEVSDSTPIENENSPKIKVPQDFSDFQKDLIEKTSPYTMTSPERMGSLINAIEYILKNNIQGDFVECGVWRGGSALLMISTLLNHGITDRVIHLYDTFEGMSPPTDLDISIAGESAKNLLNKKDRDEEDHLWAYAPLARVQELLMNTGYPKDNLKYYKGKVEDTLPKNIPSRISLLRLDTDWYESTKHELIHLYPLLEFSGVLIIDDYGHWQGARKAVNEYFQDKKILLNRIDYTGRIAVKP